MPNEENTNPNMSPDLEPVTGEPGWYIDHNTGQTVHESELGGLVDDGLEDEWDEDEEWQDEDEGDQDDYDRNEKKDESQEENNRENNENEPDNPNENGDAPEGPEGEANPSPASEGMPEGGAEAAGEAGAEAAELAAETAAEVAAEAAATEAVAASAVAVESTPVGWILTAIATVIVVVVLVIIIVLAFMGYGTDEAAGDTTGGCAGGSIIVIDPGHPSEHEDSTTQAEYDADEAGTGRGAATGGTGSGVVEKTINQQVSDKLKTKLEAEGYTVFLTKTDANSFMSNRERGRFARDKKADLYIRIHNDDGAGSPSGTVFYYPDTTKYTPTESWQPTDLVGTDEYPFRLSAETAKEDADLATALNTSFETGGIKYSDGTDYPNQTKKIAKAFGYNYDITTSLIEMSSLEYDKDAKFISNSANQDKLVTAFSAGIKAHMPPGGGGCDILDVPYMNQFTTDIDTCPVDGSTRWDHKSKAGCGITSQAMVETFILGKKVTPDDIYYGRNGHPAQDIFFEYETLNSQIASKGVQYKRMTTSNAAQAGDAMKKIETTISKGYPAIIHTWPPFASKYHIMVVVGFNENGDVYINDPNCGPTSAKAYLEFTVGTGKARLASRAAITKALYYNSKTGATESRYVEYME